MSRLTRGAALVATIALASAVVSACGGGTDGSAPTRDRSAYAPGSPQNPVAASTVDAKTAAAARKKGHFNESAPPQDATTASAPGAGESSGPCDLVPSEKVRSIVGAPVGKPTEAPQGPTCIYRSRSGKAYLTVAVERLSGQALKAQIKGIPAINVSGRKGYCRSPDRMALYVPLEGGRVLTVGAPCSRARAFAVTALPRLVP